MTGVGIDFGTCVLYAKSNRLFNDVMCVLLAGQASAWFEGHRHEEIDIMDSAGCHSEMIRLAGGRSTVPQIFIGGRHIGGFDQLAALDKASELDFLLNVR